MTITVLTRREFGLLAGAGALAALSAHAGQSAAAVNASAVASTALPPAAFDITPYVDPELRAVLPEMREMMQYMARVQAAGLQLGSPQAPPPPPAVLKRMQSLMANGQQLPHPVVSERKIPGAAGAPEVRIYVINAGAGGAARPAILHIHGGGYVSGSAGMGVRGLQELALALDCVIVTVDYRLAPATRFPGSLDDNYAGLVWLLRNAAELGVDPRRMAVMGESAGGGHAAMLAIAARDRGEVPLCYQALIYPMLDDRIGSTRQAPPPKGQVLWTAAQNVAGWTALLGVPAGSPVVPAGAVPARVANLKGLPPTFIGVGAIDLFVDEDMEYARRLLDLGIAVELQVVPGAFHGFDVVAPQTGVARRFKATVAAALQRAFAATG